VPPPKNWDLEFSHAAQEVECLEELILPCQLKENLQGIRTLNVINSNHLQA